MAGSARGRRLVTPDGNEVRPTSDRVREATFNALGSLDAVVGATVVDLFAGSGALGVEALSRGAAAAVFLDTSQRAVQAVKENLAACDMSGRATVQRADALDWLRSAPERGDAAADLVLADPPYPFDRWPDLFDAVRRVAPGAVVVVESDREVTAGAADTILRMRRYGGTVVTIIRLAGTGPSDPPDSEDLT